MTRTRKAVIGWIVGLIAILVGAWMLSTVLQLVANQNEAQKDRVELENEVSSLAASRDELRGAIQELNKRCEDAKDCIPIDVDDLVGATGPTGATGAQGIPGLQGLAGKNGRDGQNGSPGATGAQGEQGEPGLNGKDGATGPPGPKGDKGDAGATGQNGTSAVPFTFRFTWPGNGQSPDVVYTCVVTAPDTIITCQAA